MAGRTRVDPLADRTAIIGQPLHAIVLCKVLTGYATVRALARAGVRVHAIVFDPWDPLRRSRYPDRVTCVPPRVSAGQLMRHIEDVAHAMGRRPALIPTSDVEALLIARHRARLQRCCRVGSTDHTDLLRIIDKVQLYRAAEAKGLPVVPWMPCGDAQRLAAWLSAHAPPYIVKPGFSGMLSDERAQKNWTFSDADTLRAFLSQQAPAGLLVQQRLHGGDGAIFDAYGYCDRHGAVRSIATHVRLRQHPPHLGSTTYGQIPAAPRDDAAVIGETLALLDGLGYHGIFGIEWLKDRASGRYYLLDFNARPFSSIGHLVDAGVNLPEIAVRELHADHLQGVSVRPHIRASLWVDAARDAAARAALPRHERLSLMHWMRSVWVADHGAYRDWQDPWPGVQMGWRAIKTLVRSLR